jgi:hypothetical protein
MTSIKSYVSPDKSLYLCRFVKLELQGMESVSKTYIFPKTYTVVYAERMVFLMHVYLRNIYKICTTNRPSFFLI